LLTAFEFIEWDFIVDKQLNKLTPGVILKLY